MKHTEQHGQESARNTSSQECPLAFLPRFLWCNNIPPQDRNLSVVLNATFSLTPHIQPMAKSPSIATSILLLLIALREDFIICQGLISTTMLIYLSCPGRIHFSLPGCSPQHVNPATSLGEIVSIALCSSCTSTHPQSQQELIMRVCKIPSAPLGKCSSAILLFIYVFLILIFIDYN